MHLRLAPTFKFINKSAVSSTHCVALSFQSGSGLNPFIVMDIFDNVIFVGVPGMDQLSGLDKGQLSGGKIASFSCLKRSWFFFLYDIRVAPKVHSILLGSKAALQQIATSLVLWAKYYMPGNN